MCLEMCFLKNSSRINRSVELNEKKSNEEDFDATYAISPLFFFDRGALSFQGADRLRESETVLTNLAPDWPCSFFPEVAHDGRRKWRPAHNKMTIRQHRGTVAFHERRVTRITRQIPRGSTLERRKERKKETSPIQERRISSNISDI